MDPCVAESVAVSVPCTTTADSSNVAAVVSRGDSNEISMTNSKRARFYSHNGEVHNKVKSGGTTVITRSRYDEIVKNLCEYSMTEKKSQDMKNSYKRYSLGTQIKHNKLFR
jgi:hypothetical protein